MLVMYGFYRSFNWSNFTQIKFGLQYIIFSSLIQKCNTHVTLYYFVSKNLNLLQILQTKNHFKKYQQKY